MESKENKIEEAFMKRAIELAKRGQGWTNPNPLVGAVIVKDNTIISEGYHKKFGEKHAECDAICNAQKNNIDLKGATLFVTLEPCCHTGKQPPCTDAIIDSGISRVVIGSFDPNPLVFGGGIKKLRENGILVETDFLKDECDALNPIFFHFITKKTPFVILKYAMTADGLTATSSGESKWITGEKARAHVHQTRANVMAVMTGIGTAIKDDPLLNARFCNKNVRQPVRIVPDSHVRLPPTSHLAKTAKEIPVILFCANELSSSEERRKNALASLGVEIISVSSQAERLSLDEILKTLGERGIDSVLVESGGTLTASFLFPKILANEIHAYVSPKIFGTVSPVSFTPVRGIGTEKIDSCVQLSEPKIEIFGSDVLLRYAVLK